LVQTSLSTDCQMYFGDSQWTDYEFILEARKKSGQEGFLILFRVADRNNFYWWNLGGWGNQYHALECEINGERRIFPRSPTGTRSIQTDHWYAIRIRAEGDHFQGFLDGEKLLDLRHTTHPRGRVGLGTWNTAAEFRNLIVTSLDGQTLWTELPRLE
jgi:alpha-L-arabinofuranosidase